MKQKTAYFDCFAGASGDMLLGALLDAGLDLAAFEKEIARLGLGGYRLSTGRKTSKGITGTTFDVTVTDTHSHRTLSDILALIEKSGLSRPVRTCSAGVFQRLGEVEGGIHNIPVSDVHFHEVGAVDSIIDIVGFFVALKMMNITSIYASKLHVGTGTFACVHGVLPCPAPATMELLKGIPVYSTGIESELVTPTGAALLAASSEGFGPMPAMTVESVGYGVGSRELPIANVLRVTIGTAGVNPETEEVRLIETNIDDMNPQFYGHIMDLLFEAGALDVFFTPVIMKKNRPGIILSVMAHSGLVEELSSLIFRETTTFGLRVSEVKKRMTLSREFIYIDTAWGTIKTKVRILDDYRKSAFPEYEDCRKAASEHGVPIQKIYTDVKKKAEAIFRENGKEWV
ncbi:nickel pincer cofactor biosynthesis protein LarC [bacterium]|nr:nickel pincer cofactor biosynthesis protein LarC [bacterium]